MTSWTKQLHLWKKNTTEQLQQYGTGAETINKDKRAGMNRKATFVFRGKEYTVKQSDTVKRVDGPDYHRKTDLTTGFTQRWGKTKKTKHDPVMAPWAEIADVEISTGCKANCKFCYKGNGPQNKADMSPEDFERLLQTFSIKTDNDEWISPVDQIALGLTDNNRPNVLPIFKLCRDYGIVPNCTTNSIDLTEDMIKEWGKLLGAVAVSNYGDICLDTIEALTRLTGLQVNIHQLLAEETYDQCIDILEKAEADPRLSKLGAVVFLSLKPKGRGRNLTQLQDPQKYRKLIDTAHKFGINYGMDSCGAPQFLKSISNSPDFSRIAPMVDACESMLHSIYATVGTEVWPCSFSEDELGWWTPPKLTEVTDFISEVWDAPQARIWRNNLLNSTSYEACKSCSVKSHCRTCPIHNLNLCRRM